MTSEHEHGCATHAEAPDHRPLLKTPAGWALCAFLAIGAFYLVTEHTAHLFGALPYLLLLACPLMHLFMHGGHGGHQHGKSETGKEDQP
ncbi:hypothetical protein M2322_004884 [Rhodoblastus acidophilus]|uniref:DUF2933 domain-containing protein n=1 Tax=Rhodoblastus acidophilus TaxID=1074 RepID=UPI0022249847|nr:DUF2933 domain-containing protein [Rhodoblastus acidophilus]MCW2319309.1 hypothetical protein [Rhodoblastus acidophilus]